MTKEYLQQVYDAGKSLWWNSTSLASGNAISGALSSLAQANGLTRSKDFKTTQVTLEAFVSLLATAPQMGLNKDQQSAIAQIQVMLMP